MLTKSSAVYSHYSAKIASLIASLIIWFRTSYRYGAKEIIHNTNIIKIYNSSGFEYT